MQRQRVWLLLLIAVVLRLVLQGWDVGSSSTTLHPDERQIGFITEKVDGWFTDPGFYAYGSLHFQLVRAVAATAGLDDSLRELVVSGRLVSLAASMLALILGWLIARRAWGDRTAGLYLVLVAWVPLDLQQSHFATVEAHHAAWVTASLAACFWLATGGRTLAATAAGLAIGSSLAVKVSSLALVLPLAAALLLACSASILRFWHLAAAAVAAATAGFWLCQPSAFAAASTPLLLTLTLVAAAAACAVAERQATAGRRRAALAVAAVATAAAVVQVASLSGLSPIGPGLAEPYLRGVGEQVNMVVGRGDLPYVRVYAHTVPVLYPLRELAAWGWGPGLLAAALAGAVAGARALWRRWRGWLGGRWNRSSVLLLLLLLWLVPMAARLATLQVKYLRYWEPLVVPAVLVAAWWISRLPHRSRRPLGRLAIAATLVWGLAYLWAFLEPHPHRTADRWLTPMLAAGQAVAFESWDETLPLEPEVGPVERLTLPTYDLPDDRAKVERWVGELSRADWVVLTSNRIVKTVLANPERFPLTGRLYRLLLTGEAGFEPLARVSRGPRVFDLHWPVQLADESFLNYDFPQVVILRKISAVPETELVERVQRPLPFLEDLDFASLQRRHLAEIPTVPPQPSAVRQLLDLAIWTAVFSLLALATWALLLPLLRSLPDAGIGLAATSGWIALAWLMWFGNKLGLWPAGPETASWLFLAGITAGLWTASRRRQEITELLQRRRGTMVLVVAVTAAVGLLFVIVRAGNPAIYWGEKPMDFAFLNAFLDAPAWPPGEPWMAGMPLHYYYFGEVLSAAPILIAGCSPAVGYNLMVATIPALATAVLAGLGLLAARRRRWFAATALPLLVVLSGNLAWPWLLDLARQGKWFDLWWATSRVIPGFAIDEYPLWTALFADLHGHFIALPVLLAALGWGWLAVREPGRRWLVPAAACGVATAALVATNPWDLFILTSALGLGCLAAARRPLAGLARLVAAAAISVVAAAPFISELLTGIEAGAGGRGLFLTDGDFAPASAILRHFGLFLVPLLAAAVVHLGRRGWQPLPLAGLGILAGLWLGSPAAALTLALTALFAIALLHSAARLDRLAWGMALLGTLAVAACERFTLIDRMNTIFKIYNGVWLVLAMALGILLLRGRGWRRKALLVAWLPLQAVAFVNLPLGIAQGWLQPRIQAPTPSLDGQAYLAATDPQTWFLVRSLQGAARPGEVVAESAGPYYSQHTRIVMHTGQPTVVGWEWHLTQRGQAVDEITARMADLETLYSGQQSSARRAVLERYRVQWVVLADLERERYGLHHDENLRGVPGLVEVASRSGASLYRVLPIAAGGTRTVRPAFELPAGAVVVAALPELPREPAVRSLALVDDGALVLLRDRRILELDRAGRLVRESVPPQCEAASLAVAGGVAWIGCEDGRLLRRTGDRWSAAGQVAAGSRLAGGDTLWAWGAGGLLELTGDRWRQRAQGPVTAAAARGGWVAWSDGSTVTITGPESGQRVGGVLDGVRGLAWSGLDLVALAEPGLLRSGGAILPWRTLAPGTDVAAIAGHRDVLWLVHSQGLVLELADEACPDPWDPSSTARGTGLREPRDLAASPDGWFAVADSLNHRIVWYSLGGTCLDQVGDEGSALSEFREPSGLAVAADGALAVTDTWNGRLQILRPDGSAEAVGAALYGPRDALWAANGSLLVADTGNRRLLRFDPPDWQQIVMAELEGPVVGVAELDGRVAAAVPQAGVVVVLDPSSGLVTDRLPVPGWSGGNQQEGYLAVLPSGELAASAPQTGELWVLDPAGEVEPRLLRDGLPGVTGLAVLPDGSLLASLTWEHRLVTVPVER